VSRNPALRSLWCSKNKLTAEALNALFSGLPTRQDCTIGIAGNPGSNTCNRSIATEKGWKFNN
jgi:hypothetical protein